VLKASVEDRRIDFRLVDEPGSVDATPPPPPRGQPAKRKKARY
jgi:ribonuclease R